MTRTDSDICEDLPDVIESPDVLIVTASVGAGHNQAAKAVMAALEQGSDDLTIQWIDLMNMTGRFFSLCYRGGYAKLVSNCPRAYGWGYRYWDKPGAAGRPLREKLRLLTERRALKHFTGYLRRCRPKVILHTHFLAPAIVGSMPDFDSLETRQVVVVTDYMLHRFWYADNVDRYFVASQGAANRLQSFGIDTGRIRISGIPVHRKWYDLPDPQQLRDQWNVKPGRKVVTITAGADFTLGNVYKLAEDLLAARDDVEIIALAGANKRLLASLANLAKGCDRLRNYGFTDKINEIIAMSDLVLTKSGGLMTTECVTAGRAMVFFPPLPGQEAQNAEYLTECGAATIASDTEDMLNKTCKLLDEPQAIAEMSQASLHLRKDSANMVADYICEQL